MKTQPNRDVDMEIIFTDHATGEVVASSDL